MLKDQQTLRNNKGKKGWLQITNEDKNEISRVNGNEKRK
jgi:hypothetical protein